MKILASFLFLALSLASCGTPLVQPTTAATVADAVNLDTIAVRVTDTYVKTGMPDAVTLRTLSTDAKAVHDALLSLEADQKAGRNVSLAAFNAAYRAFDSYKTSKGIK